MREVENQFPIFEQYEDQNRLVYLDSAATSLTPQCVIDAVSAYYTECNASVHRAMHALAEEATRRFEDSRHALARFIGADEREIVFTRGATEAINLVKRGFPGLERVATTIQEHHSNFIPWAYSEQSEIISIDDQGRLDLDQLESSLRRGIDLLAVTHVSNVLGAMNPIPEIVKLARQHGTLVLLDAAQSVSHCPIDVQELDVDFLVCSGHKMLGPGGVGLLYGKSCHLNQMSPVLLGGNMVESVYPDRFELQELPSRFEAGSAAVEAVIGWGAAVEFLDDFGMESVARHTTELGRYATERLAQIDRVTLLGDTAGVDNYGIVSFRVAGLESHAVSRMLSHRANAMVRSGFHCAQPLHQKLGSPPSLRASFHVYNRREDVEVLAEFLTEVTKRIG